MATLATTLRTPATPAHPAAVGRIAVQLAWFGAGLALSFAVPYVFSSLLELNHDAYYAVYFAAVLAFLAAYVRLTALHVASFARQSWRWSLALAVPATAFVVVNVLSRDGTPGPGGPYLAFELAWRGLAYGLVDALLLTAFPATVAFRLLRGRITGLRRRLLFAAVMLPLVVTVTGVYHLGYEQYREDGIAAPEFGNTVISVPALATTNPIGSLITHAAMHIAAEAHVHETDIFLPPQTDAPSS